MTPTTIVGLSEGMRATVVEAVEAARRAARDVAAASTEQKDGALNAMAAALREQRKNIQSANVEDVSQARSAGLSSALLDRLLHHGHILKCGPRSWRTQRPSSSRSSGQENADAKP